MKKYLFSAGLLLFAPVWAGLPVYLESQSGIGNGMQACVYSDHSVITVKADEMCPTSNDSDPAETSNRPPDIDDDQNQVDD